MFIVEFTARFWRNMRWLYGKANTQHTTPNPWGSNLAMFQLILYSEYYMEINAGLGILVKLVIFSHKTINDITWLKSKIKPAFSALWDRCMILTTPKPWATFTDVSEMHNSDFLLWASSKGAQTSVDIQNTSKVTQTRKNIMFRWYCLCFPLQTHSKNYFFYSAFYRNLCYCKVELAIK